VKGVKVKGTEPSCRLGTYQSRRVWSGGQGAKETVGGALEVTEGNGTVEGAEDVSVEGAEAEEAGGQLYIHLTRTCEVFIHCTGCDGKWCRRHPES